MNKNIRKPKYPNIYARNTKTGRTATLSCAGCFMLVLAVNLTIGAYAFNYCLESIWGTKLSIWYAMLGGLFLGEAAIPSAVIIWLVRLSGVPAPFVN